MELRRSGFSGFSFAAMIAFLQIDHAFATDLIDAVRAGNVAQVEMLTVSGADPIREEDHNGETVWAETLVGPSLLKSVPARVTKKDNSYRITGATWGARIAKVDVKIDDGQWLPATLDNSEEAEFAWKIWHLDWGNPQPGEHTVTSRAIDASGQAQPTMDDPWIVKKKIYWESNGQVTRRISVS